MKRRILLVDDEVAVLLTMKAILEISGYEVDTAASARDGRLKLRKNEYQMVITDMRMENEEAGVEVIRAAREATYYPAVALLTAFPLADEDWRELGADKMLVKPMHTQILLKQIERLMDTHEAKKLKGTRKKASATKVANAKATVKLVAKSPAKKTAKKAAAKKPSKQV